MNIKKASAALLVIFAVAMASFACGKYGGDWVAKFDGDKITVEELNAFYYAQLKSMYNMSKEDIDKLAADPAQVSRNPMLNKAEFLEQLIRQRLVYNKAVDEKVLKNQDLDAMIQMAKEAIVLQFYIREKFKNEIVISPQEVEDIFTKQKERFKGVPGDQAEMFIRQQVFQQKLQMKAGELLQNLRDQSGVKKNLEPLKIKEAKPEVRMEVKPEVKPEDKAKK